MEENGNKDNKSEDIKNLTINDDSDIIISMVIDGECIFQRLGITKEEAIGVLKIIGYGKIGDEKFNITT
jgi:hypothetical protein